MVYTTKHLLHIPFAAFEKVSPQLKRLALSLSENDTCWINTTLKLSTTTVLTNFLRWILPQSERGEKAYKKSEIYVDLTKRSDLKPSMHASMVLCFSSRQI
jgi:hypothetical protein